MIAGRGADTVVKKRRTMMSTTLTCQSCGCSYVSPNQRAGEICGEALTVPGPSSSIIRLSCVA